MKLLVFDAIYIPGYGMGPFITPIEITDPILLAEVKRKSRVKVLEDRKVSKKRNDNNTYPISIGQSTAKKENVETVEVAEEVEEVKEEVVEVPETVEVAEEVEEVVEEVVVEEPQEEKVLLTEEDLKDETVAELKARLDAMGIEYLYKDSKNILIRKVIENQ